MRAILDRSRFKLVALGLLGLLVVGGVVGAATLDGGGGDDQAAQTAVAPDSQGVDPLRQGAPEPHAAPQAAGGDAVASGGPGGSMGEDGVTDEAAQGSGGGGLDPSTLGGEAPPPVGGEHVVKTATIDLEVEEGSLDGSHQKALRVVSAAGGFVQSSAVSESGATLTFRVPSDKFESALAEMRGLGEVDQETVTGEDVSEEFVDLEARLRHWRAQEAVFLDLMTQARTISETVEVRRELSVIQQTIEQLEGRRRFLEDRTSFATLTLSLFEPDGAAPAKDRAGQGTLSEAWDTAWDAALEVVGGSLIVLGVLIPLTAIAGIPAFVAWILVRRRRGEPPAASAPAV